MTALRLLAVTVVLLIVALGIPSLTVAALWGAAAVFGLAAVVFVAALFGHAR